MGNRIDEDCVRTARASYGSVMGAHEQALGYAAAHELAFDAAVADVMVANGDDHVSALRATLVAAAEYATRQSAGLTATAASPG